MIDQSKIDRKLRAELAKTYPQLTSNELDELSTNYPPFARSQAEKLSEGRTQPGQRTDAGAGIGAATGSLRYDAEDYASGLRDGADATREAAQRRIYGDEARFDSTRDYDGEAARERAQRRIENAWKSGPQK